MFIIPNPLPRQHSQDSDSDDNNEHLPNYLEQSLHSPSPDHPPVQHLDLDRHQGNDIQEHEVNELI